MRNSFLEELRVNKSKKITGHPAGNLLQNGMEVGDI